MSSQVFTLSATNTALPSTGLGFEARSVMVTNYTNQYVRVDGTGVDVPPFIFGALLRLPPGTRWAKASLQPTTPAVIGPPLSNTNATLTYVDAELPPDPGHLLAQAQFSQQVLLGTVSVPTGGGPTALTFPVPAGAVSIGYGCDDSGPNVVPSLVVIVGGVTRTPYRTDNSPGAPPVHTCLLMSTDTSVSLEVTASAIGPAVVRLYAWTAPVAMTVALDTQSPAPWQGATQTFAVLSVLASGANSASLITFPNAGYLYALAVTTDLTTAAGSVEVQNTAAGNALIAKGSVNAGGTGPLINTNLSGASLDSVGGAIKGIRLANKGSAASDLYLTAAFTST